jgi:hypothetical protein
MTLTAMIFLLVSGWTVSSYIQANLFWGSTNGIMVASKVVTQSASEDGVTYRPDVSYRYEVDGKSYVSDNFGLGLQHLATASGSEDSAQEWVNEHPAGSKIAVRYSKANPQTAAIELRPDAFVALLALFPIPHFFFGLAMLFGTTKQPESARRMSGSFIKLAGVWGVMVAVAFVALHAFGWATGALVAAYFAILMAVALTYQKSIQASK